MSKQSLLQSVGLKKSTTMDSKATAPEDKKKTLSKTANAANATKPKAKAKAKAKAEASSSSAGKKRGKFSSALGKNKLSICKCQPLLSFLAIKFSTIFFFFLSPLLTQQSSYHS